EESLERYGFYLEEISESAGINFVHQGPVLDNQLDHILPQVGSMGASVSVVDYNKDGYQDIYVTNSNIASKNSLFKNLADGTFEDVADELGLADANKAGAGVSMGAVWGDMNNNGYEDLFLYKWGKPELFRNEEGKGFTRITEKSGLPGWVNANTAIWVDYNGNGLLDLFIGGFYPETIDLWNLKTTKIMPESYEYARNGGRNFLLENMGNGRFEDVTEKSGLTGNRWTLAAAAADLNGSGYPDLMLANDYGIDEIYLNNDGASFESAAGETGIGFVPKSGMSVAFGDVMNQGSLAIYITNISEPGFLVQGNNLWVPSGRSAGENLKYRNLAGNMGIALGDWAYGGQFGDLNNNGSQDLYVANGYVSSEDRSEYWYDFSKVAAGNISIIEDARNWPAMNGRSFSGYQQNKIWINDGAGKYREVSSSVGGALGLDSRAVAYADLWNRGVLDVIVASQGGPLRVYKNTVAPGYEWVSFKLTGTESNRSAIGAQVKLFWNGRQQLQVVTGGSGFSAQNQLPLHFGLGKNPEIEKVEIQWPSGKVQELDTPEPNMVHTIKEP
ncbi:MAG: CRTAC1 family protein, partial [Balneolales bacterium]